jgi:predicted RNA binding protein with dsRBD fold (UPF0201 family)
MTIEPTTPTKAIAQAIRSLQHDRLITSRKDGDYTEVLAELDQEIAALEEARRLLKEYDALKAMLKAVVS